jgi:GNAT superfamily N-acetyltransferase
LIVKSDKIVALSSRSGGGRRFVAAASFGSVWFRIAATVVAGVFLGGTSVAKDRPFYELPMYGGVEKTSPVQKADKEFIAGHITADTSCVLVAQQDGRLVGYCLAVLAQYPPVFQTRDYGTVFDLAVTRQCRRAGVGEKLYRAAEAWFADRGIHRIEIRVAVSNEVSTAFWKKMGFSPYVTTVFKNI